jgi:hypothetical protein
MECKGWMNQTKVLFKAVKHVAIEKGFGCNTCGHARLERRHVNHSSLCDVEKDMKRVQMQGIFQSNLRGYWIVEEVDLPENIDDEGEQMLLKFRQEMTEFSNIPALEIGIVNLSISNFSYCVDRCPSVVCMDRMVSMGQTG